MRKPIIDDRAIVLWQEDLYSLQMIGDFFGVSRQAVMKYLRKHGIDTGSGGRVEVSCDYCGKVFKKPRAYVRARRKNYCSSGHYYAAIHNSDYFPNRQGQRVARRVVKWFYPLGESDIVHHIDGDTTNNEIANLMVFRSNSDHMRWHRLGGEESGVVPLFPKKEVKLDTTEDFINWRDSKQSYPKSKQVG